MKKLLTLAMLALAPLAQADVYVQDHIDLLPTGDERWACKEYNRGQASKGQAIRALDVAMGTDLSALKACFDAVDNKHAIVIVQPMLTTGPGPVNFCRYVEHEGTHMRAKACMNGPYGTPRDMIIDTNDDYLVRFVPIRDLPSGLNSHQREMWKM